MKKYTGKIRIATVIMGLISTPWLAMGVHAQEQIRINPSYKAPSIQDSISALDDLVGEELQDDFLQFLNPQEEAEQYILLTDPKDRGESVLALGESNDKSVPLLQVNHEYQYNPSISFNLPAISPAIGSSVTPGLLSSSGQGGSQLVVSLNPSRKEGSPFKSNKSLELVVGSSFINMPTNRYATFLNDGLLAQRAYNLSLGVGYSGFRLGASYSRNDFLFSSDMSGFDLGFGYMSDTWSANLRLGEYSKSASLLLSQDYDIFEHISAYELGAAYRLFSNVSLTGRFTYYSYGMSNEFAGVDDVQSLIFGTNLSF